jgi:hypothetical protein
MIKSYPKIWTVGDKNVKDIFLDKVVIQEKIDGSQISFGLIDGVLNIRSKSNNISIDTPVSMFSKGVDYIKFLYKEKSLINNIIYRGEYLQKNKHNVLKYNRIPDNHIIVYDVEEVDKGFIYNIDDIEFLCNKVDLEYAPVLFRGIIVQDFNFINSLLNTESILGNEKIEGVVIKNYYRQSVEGYSVMVAKRVSPTFKERHKIDWKIEDKNIIKKVSDSLKTDALYLKAIQHLRDDGKLTDSVKDISNLITELKNDIKVENESYISSILFKHFIDDIIRMTIKDFPLWYKDYLFKLEN